MIVKISNGEVHIKEVCTRKLRKEMKKALYTGVTVQYDKEGNVKQDGLSMLNFDSAQDVAVLGMCEKIIIDGKEVPIVIETLDNLADSDYEKIFEAVDGITNKTLPKE